MNCYELLSNSNSKSRAVPGKTSTPLWGVAKKMGEDYLRHSPLTGIIKITEFFEKKQSKTLYFLCALCGKPTQLSTPPYGNTCSARIFWLYFPHGSFWCHSFIRRYPWGGDRRARITGTIQHGGTDPCRGERASGRKCQSRETARGGDRSAGCR